MSTLKVTSANRNGNKLNIKFTFTVPGSHGHHTAICPELVHCGLIKFQIKTDIYYFYNDNSLCGNNIILIKLAKIFPTDSMIYKIIIEYGTYKKSLYIVDENINNASWHQIYDNESRSRDFNFEFSLSLEIISVSASFPSFWEEDDTDSSVFELRGVDGSVKVHKAVLAGYSPVMKTMLAGEWKEVSAGVVQIQNTTKITLQQLKDYMYLHKLPEEGIEDLAALASCYMMTELQEYCATKLLMTVTAENAAELLGFAFKYDIERLKLGILVQVQGNAVKVEDLIKKSNTAANAEPSQ